MSQFPEGDSPQLSPILAKKRPLAEVSANIMSSPRPALKRFSSNPIATCSPENNDALKQQLPRTFNSQSFGSQNLQNANNQLQTPVKSNSANIHQNNQKGFQSSFSVFSGTNSKSLNSSSVLSNSQSMARSHSMMARVPNSQIARPEHPSMLRRSPSQNSAAQNEQVWPPEIEEAFMEAIKKIPQLGRRKLLVKGKACGRNELISEYIFLKTGSQRTRKQVSSHIQVLKHMRRDDPEFLSLITDTSSDSSNVNIPDNVNLFFPAPSAAIGASMQPSFSQSSSSSLLTPSPLESRSFSFDQNVTKQMESHQPPEHFAIKDFCLFDSTNQHLYTRNAPQAFDVSMIGIDEVANWDTLFPDAYEILLNPYSPGYLTTNIHVFHIKSGFSLPSAPQMLNTSNLAINFSIIANMVGDSINRRTWFCRNSIYKSSPSQYGARQVLLRNEYPLNCNNNQLSPPFELDFWAHLINGPSSSSQNISAEERERKVSKAIKDITMMQVISDLAGKSKIVLLWQFYHAASPKPAQTSISEVVLPSRGTLNLEGLSSPYSTIYSGEESPFSTKYGPQSILNSSPLSMHQSNALYSMAPKSSGLINRFQFTGLGRPASAPASQTQFLIPSSTIPQELLEIPNWQDNLGNDVNNFSMAQSIEDPAMFHNLMPQLANESMGNSTNSTDDLFYLTESNHHNDPNNWDDQTINEEYSSRSCSVVSSSPERTKSA